MKIIKLVGLASGQSHPFAGAYVMSYDVHALTPTGKYDGGWLQLTANPAEALRLCTKEAFQLWRAQHGIRPDGKPNCPLTAFTVEFIEVPS